MRRRRLRKLVVEQLDPPPNPNAAGEQPAGRHPGQPGLRPLHAAGRRLLGQGPRGLGADARAAAPSSSPTSSTPSASRQAARRRAPCAGRGGARGPRKASGGKVAPSPQAGPAVRIDLPGHGARPTRSPARRGTDAVERYVFFHNGKQVVLTLSGPEGRRQRRPVADRHRLAAVDGDDRRRSRPTASTASSTPATTRRSRCAASRSPSQPGELVAVTGPVGSGKSTLLACLAGLDEPDGGMVAVAGERLSRRPEEERARAARPPHRRALPAGQPRRPPLGRRERRARPAPRRRAADADWRDEVLERCGLAGARARAPRAALRRRARPRRPGRRAGQRPARCCSPTSPTGELDDVTAERVLDLLRERADEGAAVRGRHPQRRGGRARRSRDPAARRGARAMTASRSCAATAPPAPTGTAPPRPSRSSPPTARSPPGDRDRARRPVRLGQVDAAPPARRARPADRRVGQLAGDRRRAPRCGPGPVAVIFQGPSLLAPLTVARERRAAALLDGARDGEAAQARARRAGAARARRAGATSCPRRSRAARRSASPSRAPRRRAAPDPRRRADRPARPRQRRRVVDVLLAAAEHAGAALVVATHDPAVAERLPSAGRCTAAA